MKRFLTLLLLIAATAQMMAQNPASSRRPIWVGLDMGGVWQASDMKGLGGIGWSFTLSRYSKLDKKGPLYYGWRFRFLDGRSYGYNYHRLYGLNADPVMSSGATDYNTPTANNDGYAFSNYKFRFDEFAYELIIGSNGLRKHGVLLYGFGGIGATHWKTTTNQLDAFDQRYDYSSINSGGNDDILRDDLDHLWLNGDYETVANGSSSSGKWGIMPSAGIGFGYQFGNAVALGVEHRTTWARNDNIDGVNHDHTGAATPNNDLYNYDGFFIRWTFGGNSRSDNTAHNNTDRPANPNDYTTTQPTPPNNTTTVVTPPNNNPPNNNPPNNNYPNNPPNNNQPALPPPTVQFTTPNVDPYNATTANQQLVVRILNVTAANQITLVINNQVSTNFGFNPSTHTMVFSHTLQAGTNVYHVTASNQVGSASDVQTIILKGSEGSSSSALPPQVTITNPATDPFNSAVQTMTVNATVINVTSASNIQVSRNGTPITNFNFNPSTHLVSFVANLQTGSNLYEVIGTNSVGSASDHTTITYNPVAPVQPPVVTITSPSACPFSVKSTAYTISANITNVTTASQVHILFNGNAVTQFNFTAFSGYAQISFPVTLVPGVNPFTITGTNTAGTNSKSCEITYKITTQTPAVPPTVTITSPAQSPYASPTQSYTVVATVLNVASQNEITVTKNNATVNSWTYNMSNHVLTLPTNLSIGNNVFTVSASNANGSDSKTTVITFQPAPPVEIRNPTTPTATVTVNPVDPPGGNNPQDPNANTGPQDPNTNASPQNPGGNSSQDPNAGSSGVSITLVSPSLATFTTSSQALPVSMNVLGANASNEITVRVNSVPLTNFNYNTSTHSLTFNVNLVGGANTILVTVSNAAGTASSVLTVTYAAVGRGNGNSSGSSGKGSSSTSTPKSTSSSSSSSTSAPKPESKPATQPTKPTTTTTESKPETKPATSSGTTTTAPATSGKGSTTAPATAPSTTAPKPR